MMMNQLKYTVILLILPVLLSAQSGEKPNILVIWGDDIGWSNLSVYNHAVWDTALPILAGLHWKVPCLQITMHNHPVLQGGLPLSQDNIPSGPE